MSLSEAQRQELLEAFQDVRVADVRDALDCLLMHFTGSMSPQIRPLWRTRAYGIARTARYVPYDGPTPVCSSPQEYLEWMGWYYNQVCPYPWVQEIQPGDFIVIDASGVNAGLIGSENSLACLRRGARGFVTSGAVRDTDEIILQKVPVWCALISQSTVQCRLKYEAHNVPVTVGGVQVRPGDVVVADGDGVVVVPQEKALEVAKLARQEHQRDKIARRKHYEALGLPPDESVRLDG